MTLDTYPLAMDVPVMQRVADAMYEFGVISKPYNITEHDPARAGRDRRVKPAAPPQERDGPGSARNRGRRALPGDPVRPIYSVNLIKRNCHYSPYNYR